MFGFFMAILGAVASILDKKILSDFSPYSYGFVNNVLIAIFFGLNSKTLKEGGHLIRHHALRLFFTSILNVLSFTLVLVVLKNTNVSQTMPVYKSLTLIITVLLGITILNETSQLTQKIIGSIFGIVGIFLMY